MKKIILFIALPLPILIFFFLKFFGKNEFAVPVYWESGVERMIPGCKPYPVPYLVSDSSLRALGWKGAKATLLVLNTDGIRDNMNRVKDIFNEGDYETLTIDSPSYDVKTCILLAGDTSKVVLIDDRRRIRGYYTPTTQKETDRLGVELRILLKQY